MLGQVAKGVELTGKISTDELVEDVFGLNVRGIRSISTIWVNPSAYFTAATQPDWEGRFTPSIRLWLSLIALTSLLQFIWIGGDTPLVSAYAEGFREANVQPAPGMTFEELGEQAALWIYAIAPVTQLGLFLLVLGFFPFWGEKTSYSLKIRKSFAVMIPSASLLAVFLPAMALVPATHLTAFGYMIAAGTFTLDSITGYRAGFRARSGWSRLWRTSLFAFCILTLNVIANIGTQIAGIILVSVRYGLTAS